LAWRDQQEIEQVLKESLVFQLCHSNPTQVMDVTKFLHWQETRRRSKKKLETRHVLSYVTRSRKICFSLDESVIAVCKRNLEERADLKDLKHMKKICRQLRNRLKKRRVPNNFVSRSLVGELSFALAPSAGVHPSIKEHSSHN
jgi:ribonuclease D